MEHIYTLTLALSLEGEGVCCDIKFLFCDTLIPNYRDGNTSRTLIVLLNRIGPSLRMPIIGRPFHIQRFTRHALRTMVLLCNYNSIIPNPPCIRSPVSMIYSYFKLSTRPRRIFALKYYSNFSASTGLARAAFRV